MDLRWAGLNHDVDRASPLSLLVTSTFLPCAILWLMQRCWLTLLPWLQFVFAITEPTDQIVGGHVWRSDQYGRVGTWTDVTLKMEGVGRAHAG